MSKIKKEEEKGKPIELEWCCGVNTQIPVVNLTTRGDNHTIAFAANHLVVLQDITDDKHSPLVGHRNNVTCLTSSKCKRWIASGDCGPGSCVIIWDTKTQKGIQMVDTASDPSSGTGASAICFSSDSTTLMILSVECILSFWRWSDDEPCLYAVINLDSPVSLVNRPSMACQISAGEEDEEVIVLTMPHSSIFLTVANATESVNIDGEVVERECIRFKRQDLIPDEEEIGTLREGWQFGDSIFIASDQIITYFSKGAGAILITKLQSNIESSKEKGSWKHVKMIKFCERPLTSMDVFRCENKDSVIAVSDATGHIRFLSPDMKILFWLKRPILSGLSAISFTEHEHEVVGFDAEAEESTIDKSEFRSPSLCAVTQSGCIFAVEGGNPRLVFEGAPDGDLLIIAHPARDLIIVAGTHEIRVMSTENRGKFLVRTSLDSEEISSLAFSSSGAELSIGCVSGATYQLDTLSLRQLSKLKPCSDRITEIIYSQSGLYLAAADAGYAVTLWEREDITSSKWKEMGRFRPHSSDIVQLLFIIEYGVERLLSVGKDRKLVEYVIEDKLKIHSQYKIEADAVPTCLVQYPSERYEEDFLLTTNDKFKLRMFNQSTKLPRKITNSQKYDSPITKLMSRPNNLPVLSFTTETCFGCMLLPIDGNPNREYAILANPGGITSAAAGQGSVMTCGPGIILSWKINDKALDQHRIQGGLGMAPFYNLLDEEEFKLLQNVFYFCQLEAQGLETEGERDVTRSIPLSKVADAVRALGWFPSELQIEELLTEVKFSQFHKTQEQVTEVDLDEFIKLYINHRPVDSPSQEDVENAFRILGNGSMNCGELMHTLENYGEKMSSKEFAECIEKLCGTRMFGELLHISPKDFTEKVLRF